eukprot:3583191-Pyramimonas_sp.AAC.1
MVAQMKSALQVRDFWSPTRGAFGLTTLELGLDTDIKPLIRPFTTGEFNSPLKFLRVPYVRAEL